MLKTNTNKKSDFISLKIIALFLTVIFSVVSVTADNAGEKTFENQEKSPQTAAPTVKPEAKPSVKPSTTSSKSVPKRPKEQSTPQPTASPLKQTDVKKVSKAEDEEQTQINEGKITRKEEETSEPSENTSSEIKQMQVLSEAVRIGINDKCTPKGNILKCSSLRILQSVSGKLETLGPEARQIFTDQCLKKHKDNEDTTNCEAVANKLVLTHISELTKGETKKSTKTEDAVGNVKKVVESLSAEDKDAVFIQYFKYFLPVLAISLLINYLLLIYFDVINWKLAKQSMVDLKPGIQQHLTPRQNNPITIHHPIKQENLIEGTENTSASANTDQGSHKLPENPPIGWLDNEPVQNTQSLSEESLREKELEKNQTSVLTNKKSSRVQLQIFPDLVANLLQKTHVKDSLVQYPLIKQALKKPSGGSENSVFSLINEVYKGKSRDFVIPSFQRISKEMEFSVYKEFFTVDTQFYSGEIEVVEPAEVIWDETIQGWRLQTQGKLRFV
jgi:hypothetical protein